jgi:hypothetical protein
MWRRMTRDPAPSITVRAQLVAPGGVRRALWQRLDGAPSWSQVDAGGSQGWRVLRRDREQRESVWPAGTLTGPGSRRPTAHRDPRRNVP